MADTVLVVVTRCSFPAREAELAAYRVAIAAINERNAGQRFGAVRLNPTCDPTTRHDVGWVETAKPRIYRLRITRE